MPQEECKEKILSEEYRDFMMRDTGALGEKFPLENGCRIPLKYGFELLYIDQSEDRKKPLGDYPNSTKTNAFCLGIILCNVSRSFDYLIYPYYPAYTS